MTPTVHGPVPPHRVAKLAGWLEGQCTTEDLLHATDEAGLTIDRFQNMDEYCIDVVVPLPDGLTLVYDTT